MTPEDLRARREALGLTQAQWAEWLGVGKVYVSQLEHGARRPSATLVRLVEAYLDGARPCSGVVERQERDREHDAVGGAAVRDEMWRSEWERGERADLHAERPPFDDAPIASRRRIVAEAGRIVSAFTRAMRRH